MVEVLLLDVTRCLRLSLMTIFTFDLFLLGFEFLTRANLQLVEFETLLTHFFSKLRFGAPLLNSTSQERKYKVRLSMVHRGRQSIKSLIWSYSGLLRKNTLWKIECWELSADENRIFLWRINAYFSGTFAQNFTNKSIHSIGQYWRNILKTYVWGNYFVGGNSATSGCSYGVLPQRGGTHSSHAPKLFEARTVWCSGRRNGVLCVCLFSVIY